MAVPVLSRVAERAQERTLSHTTVDQDGRHLHGRAALGMEVDEAHHRLWVAGGFSGHAWVYDARDGSTIADLTLTAPGGLINDVAVTKDAAYFTNTLAPFVYRVDPATAVSQQIDLVGGSLVPGTPDGLLLKGNTVRVVQNLDLGLPPPFGSGAPPGTDFDVVLVNR